MSLWTLGCSHGQHWRSSWPQKHWQWQNWKAGRVHSWLRQGCQGNICGREVENLSCICIPYLSLPLQPCSFHSHSLLRDGGTAAQLLQHTHSASSEEKWRITECNHPGQHSHHGLNAAKTAHRPSVFQLTEGKTTAPADYFPTCAASGIGTSYPLGLPLRVPILKSD